MGDGGIQADLDEGEHDRTAWDQPPAWKQDGDKRLLHKVVAQTFETKINLHSEDFTLGFKPNSTGKHETQLLEHLTI